MQPYPAQPYQQPLPQGPTFNQRLAMAPFNRLALLMFIIGLVGMILAFVIPSLYIEYDSGGDKYTAIYDFQLDRSGCTGDNCKHLMPDGRSELEDSLVSINQDAVSMTAASFFFVMMIGIIFMAVGFSGATSKYSPKIRQLVQFLCLFAALIAIMCAIASTLNLNSVGLIEMHNSAADQQLYGEDNTTIMTPMGIVNGILAFVLLLFLFLDFRTFWKSLPPAPQYLGTMRQAPAGYHAPPMQQGGWQR